MNRATLIVLSLALMPVTACSQPVARTEPVQQPQVVTPAPVTPPVTPNGDCNPPMNLMGKPHTVLNGMNFTQPTRILWPDSMATMDYVPERLNFVLDAGGIIRGMKCG